MDDLETTCEPAQTTSNTPSDIADVGAMDEIPRVSSLRATPQPYSMRRLLNWVSVALAAILLVALAIHALPSVLPVSSSDQTRQQNSAMPSSAAQQNLAAPTGTADGTSWHATGPDWAQDVAFSSNGAWGYACGSLGPGGAPMLVAVYNVAENSWSNLGRSFTGERCHISVSPADASDVVLVQYNCMHCTGAVPTSQIYRSHNSGASWTAINIPASQVVGDIAWTNRATLVLTTEENVSPEQHDASGLPSLYQPG
jgi:hypothetical protein